MYEVTPGLFIVILAWVAGTVYSIFKIVYNKQLGAKCDEGITAAITITILYGFYKLAELIWW